MKHLTTFEKWNSDQELNQFYDDSKIGKVSSLGIVDSDNIDPNWPTTDELLAEKEIVEELKSIQGILNESNITGSVIEILNRKAKEQVKQFHILKFEYGNDLLYSTGFGGLKIITVYDYGHTTACPYKLNLVEGYTNKVEEEIEDHDAFNRRLLDTSYDDNIEVDVTPSSGLWISRGKKRKLKKI